MPSIGEARDRMDKSVEAVRREFGSVRSGKATPALLDTVRVEAYGSRMPLNQVGTVSVPEPDVDVDGPAPNVRVTEQQPQLNITDPAAEIEMFALSGITFGGK